MTRLRFSIAELMAVVFFVGFGFAALRIANAFWSSATFSVAIITVSVAFVGACAREEGTRMSWAGFATAGGIRLAIWLLTPSTVGSLNGPPRPLLYGLQGYLNPSASGGGPFIAYVQISNSLDVIGEELSPFDVGFRLNEDLLSALAARKSAKYGTPRGAFKSMASGIGPEVA